MTDVVLVHGAWAGGWVWDTVTGPLRAAGLRPRVVELPGVGGGGSPEAGDDHDRDHDRDHHRDHDRDHHRDHDDDGTIDLDAVAAHVVAYVQGLDDGPVVLVGHSGGGVVVTRVAELAPDRVAGVVIVAGMMLPSGMGFDELCAGVGLPVDVGITRWLQTDTDEQVTVVPPEAAVAVFFHDASAGEAIAAARRLRPQQESARLIAADWTADRFGAIPRLYIEATLDRTVPIVAQRRMQQLTPGAEVVTLHTGHAPQLSAPDQVCAALADFARRVSTGPGHRVAAGAGGRADGRTARHTGLTPA